MIEYVKFHCHVMKKNDVGNKKPEVIMNEYLAKRKDGIDLHFNDIGCVVQSVKYTSGKSSIITKILRKKDVDAINENLRSE